MKAIALILKLENSWYSGSEFCERSIFVRLTREEPRIAKSEVWEIAIAVISVGDWYSCLHGWKFKSYFRMLLEEFDSKYPVVGFILKFSCMETTPCPIPSGLIMTGIPLTSIGVPSNPKLSIPGSTK